MRNPRLLLLALMLAGANILLAVGVSGGEVPIWQCDVCLNQGGERVECCVTDTCSILEKCCDPLDPYCPPIEPD